MLEPFSAKGVNFGFKRSPDRFKTSPNSMKANRVGAFWSPASLRCEIRPHWLKIDRRSSSLTYSGRCQPKICNRKHAPTPTVWATFPTYIVLLISSAYTITEQLRVVL
jgi:hypothetical protein